MLQPMLMCVSSLFASCDMTLARKYIRYSSGTCFSVSSGIFGDLQQVKSKTKSYGVNEIKFSCIMAHLVHVWNIGRMAYTPALRLQKHLTERYKSALDFPSETQAVNDILLLVEHDPVYTVGIRNREYDEKEEMRLKSLGAEFHRTNRGGLITFHGPGQLVAYPIMNLKNLDNPGVRCYVSAIEETIILMCKSFGIRAERSPHTGK